MYSDQKTQIQMQNYGCLNECIPCRKNLYYDRHCLIIVIILQNTDIVLFFLLRTTTMRWGKRETESERQKERCCFDFGLLLYDTRNTSTYQKERETIIRAYNGGCHNVVQGHRRKRAGRKERKKIGRKKKESSERLAFGQSANLK
jgi:hypothetical protein